MVLPNHVKKAICDTYKNWGWPLNNYKTRSVIHKRKKWIKIPLAVSLNPHIYSVISLVSLLVWCPSGEVSKVMKGNTLCFSRANRTVLPFFSSRRSNFVHFKRNYAFPPPMEDSLPFLPYIGCNPFAPGEDRHYMHFWRSFPFPPL